MAHWLSDFVHLDTKCFLYKIVLDLKLSSTISMRLSIALTHWKHSHVQTE